MASLPPDGEARLLAGLGDASRVRPYSLQDDGFEIRASALTRSDLEALEAWCASSKSSRSGSVRGLLTRSAAETPIRILRRFVSPPLDADAFAVRAVVFVKQRERRWSVPWHQDLTIAVRDRHDVPGFTRWTSKNGRWHVEAPPSVLARMVTVRVHLDHVGEDDGPLQVVPGTHVRGRLSSEQRSSLSRAHRLVLDGARGTVVVMRPLVLHSSRRGNGADRRVLHVEFADAPLPAPLEWNPF